MIVIRTAEELARALSQPPDSQLGALLLEQADRLAEYPLEEVACFIVVQAGDSVEAIESACGHKLVEQDHFTFPVELIAQHGRWLEITWIISDDGFGVVLLIKQGEGTDPRFLAACRHALVEREAAQALWREP